MLRRRAHLVRPSLVLAHGFDIRIPYRPPPRAVDTNAVVREIGRGSHRAEDVTGLPRRLYGDMLFDQCEQWHDMVSDPEFQAAQAAELRRRSFPNDDERDG